MHSTFAKRAQGLHRRALRPAADAARPAMRAATSGFLPIVQAKLRVGTPNGNYEEEADRVADQVTRSHEPSIRTRPLAVAQDFPVPARQPAEPVSTPAAWPALPAEPAPAAGGAPSVSLPQHIRGWQSPWGTPDRIPPRVDTPVEVGVAGWSMPMLPITLKIEGAGGGDGTVTIDGGPTAEISASTTVQLRGQDQSEFGFADELRLAAYLGPVRLSASEPFSVAAWPVTIKFFFAEIISPEIINKIPTWGAKYAMDPISDSGVLSDCNRTQISENVLVDSATGVWDGAGLQQSAFLKTQPQFDSHGIGKPTAADMIAAIDKVGVEKSSCVYHQFYRFSCARSGIRADREAGPRVPNSGFRIKYATSKEGGTYYINIQKEGFANNGVVAGEVADTKVKKAEIKD
jgi:hypothetical protein